MKVQEHPEKHKEYVQQVSDQLRQMAVNQDMQISGTYRNYAGINMQFYGMETAWTGREAFGHVAASKVFSQISELYRTDRTAFDKLLDEAQSLINKSKLKSKQNKTPESVDVKDEEWILTQLKTRNIQYIDKRLKKGCLWIVGGHELNSFFQNCRAHGYKFYYKPDGCKSFPDTEVWWTADIYPSSHEKKPLISEEPKQVQSDNKQNYRIILIEHFQSGYSWNHEPETIQEILAGKIPE